MLLEVWQGAANSPGGGNFYRRLTLVKWAAKKDTDTQVLKPGAEVSLFKHELKAVLLLDGFAIKPRVVEGEEMIPVFV